MRFAAILLAVMSFLVTTVPVSAQTDAEKLRALGSAVAAIKERNKDRYDSLERTAVRNGISDDPEMVIKAGQFYLYPGLIGYESQPKRALVYFERCGNMGHVECQYSAGKVLEHEAYNIRDYKGALKWYRKAAAGGSGDAYASMAVMHANGWGGEKDYAKSFANYLKAAELGTRGGLYGMGLQYMYGQHVEKDRGRALALFQLGKDRGDNRTGRRIRRIESGSDILDANRVARLKAEYSKRFPEKK